MTHNIDHIFYINLDKRTDRLSEIQNELSRMNLSGERFSAVYQSPPMGILGCGKSHLQVLQMAKERGYKNVLILEDDFIFITSKEIVEENIQKLFDQKPDFDVCFLAYNLDQGVSEDMPDFPFLLRTVEATTASAYIVNQHYYDKLIELYEWAMPLLEETQYHWIYANDQVWKSFQRTDKWYGFTPKLGQQSDGFSDNTNSFVSRNV